MKVFLQLTSVILSLVLLASSANAAFNYQVFNIQTQIVGTSSDIPLNSGGSSANFGSAIIGSYAVFDMVAVDDANSSAQSDFADLKITYLSDNAGAGSNLMVARTTNSQGLTDSGTISILTNIGNGSGGTISLKFEWYTPGSFVGGIEQSEASLISTRINYTTFDIDYRQLVAVDTPDIASYITNGASSRITATNDGTNISFRDNNAISSFDDPNTAAQFLTIAGPASHTITMGKQASSGNALFMFEFRDPSDVLIFNNPQLTPVPEPTTTGFLIGVIAIGFCLMKRRRDLLAHLNLSHRHPIN